MRTEILIGVIVLIIIILVAAYLLLGSPTSVQNSSSHTSLANSKTPKAGYNSSGYNASGYNSSGINRTGFNSSGTNKTTPTKAQQPQPYTVTTRYNSSLGGNYLTNASGWTLYLYMPDNDSGKSTCYSTCASIWPAFYAGNITVSSGLNASDFGTIVRTDGRMQTTYKGWPLYYYVGDKAAGEATGQGFQGFFAVTVPIIILP
jgi:predicted lipoprotein with Yx(FWY)xxD motif